MPRTRSSRLLLLSLTLLLLVLGVQLWNQREALLRVGLSWSAKQAGLVLESVTGLQASTDSLRAEQLSLTLPESGLRVDMAGLRLRFEPRRVWAERRIESLQLQRLELTRLASQPAPAETEALRPAAWLGLLERPPVRELSVEDLDLPWAQDVRLVFEQGEGGWSLRLTRGELALSGQLTPGQDGGPAVADLDLAGAGKALLNLSLRLAARGDELLLDVEGFAEAAPLADQLNANLAADLPARYLPLAGTLHFALRTGVLELLEGQALALRLSSASWLRLPEELLPELSVLELRLREDVALQLRFDAEVALDATNLALSLSGGWRQQPFTLRMDLSPACSFAPALNCQVPHQLELDSQAIPAWLQPLRVAGELQLTESTLSLQHSLAVADASLPLTLRLAGAHSLATAQGEASAVLPTLVFLPESRLSQRLPGWPWPLDLGSGGLAADADLRWQLPDSGALQWEGEATLRLEDLAGVREPFFFSGLSGDMRARIAPHAAFPLSLPPTVLRVDALDLGLPVEDLRLAFALDGEAASLRIDEFSAALLGGRVFADDQQLTLGAGSKRFELRFEGLRVERLMDLVDYKGVEASGVLSGRIPLVISAEGQVQVEQGSLSAGADGGVIRYLPSNAGAGNAGLDLVEQALSNYRYESLESTVDYRPDGELLLSMRLQGYNPDMNGGQRINLNLNLSDNIPQLLRSLQAGRRVEDFFRERVE